MKKLILVLSGLAVLGVIVVVVALAMFLGPVVSEAAKEGINRFGPGIAETSVAVEAVEISPWSGRGNVTALTVGNPDGYEAAEAISFEGITIELDPWSVLSDRVIVKRVEFNAPTFVLEQGLTANNLQTLLDTINRNLGVQKGQPPAENAKKVVIQEVIIRNAVVDARILGRGRVLNLGDITLQSTDAEGVTADVAVGQLLQLVLQRVIAALPALLNEFGIDPNAILGSLQTQGAGAITEIQQQAQQATEKAQTEAEATAERLRREAEARVSSGLRGLLNRPAEPVKEEAPPKESK